MVPQWELLFTAITGILLPLASTLGLKWNVCPEFQVRILFSYSKSSQHDKLHYQNPWSQSAFARVEGNTALACMAVHTGVRKWLYTLPSHPTLGEPQGFSWRMLTNKPTNWITTYKKRLRVQIEMRMHWLKMYLFISLPTHNSENRTAWNNSASKPSGLMIYASVKTVTW